ncbi:hypothetical protein ACRAWF_13740 [Streptomyces sp. L7]
MTSTLVPGAGCGVVEHADLSKLRDGARRRALAQEDQWRTCRDSAAACCWQNWTGRGRRDNPTGVHQDAGRARRWGRRSGSPAAAVAVNLRGAAGVSSALGVGPHVPGRHAVLF